MLLGVGKLQYAKVRFVIKCHHAIIYVHCSLVVSCGSLLAPINGSIIITEMTFGVLANFTCDEGFSLIGSLSHQCQANCNWNGNDTSCKRMFENREFYSNL